MSNHTPPMRIDTQTPTSYWDEEEAARKGPYSSPTIGAGPILQEPPIELAPRASGRETYVRHPHYSPRRS